MIINNLAGGEVEITDIKRFLGETEYDISDVYFGDKHIFESWRELESPLPITILAAGEDLIDYRIYGNTENGESVGERTENLFDDNAPDYEKGCFYDQNNTKYYNHAYAESGYIPVKAGTYSIVTTVSVTGRVLIANFFDTNKNFDSNLKYVINPPHVSTLTIPSDGYVRFNISLGTGYTNVFMFIEGSTAPTSYIPYGYKLAMTMQSTNLFDNNARDTSKGYVANAYLNAAGGIIQYPKFMISEYLPVQATSTYLFTGNNYNSAGTYIVVYNTNKDVIAAVKIDRRDIVPVYTPVNAAFVRLSFSLVPNDTKKFVCVKEENIYIGSDPLAAIGEYSDYVDYEKGKIVRYISEYTFTGDESFSAYGVGFILGGIFSGANYVSTKITTRFSHFTARTNTGISALFTPSFGDDCACFRTANPTSLMLRSSSNFTTVEECKAYFKAQYDNGTPVKMWYVLETPIEEDPPVPIPALPTIRGETIIDYDGTLKPSQMYIKYKS